MLKDKRILIVDDDEDLSLISFAFFAYMASYKIKRVATSELIVE